MKNSINLMTTHPVSPSPSTTATAQFQKQPLLQTSLQAFKTAPVENGWLLQKEILTRKLDAYRRLHPCKRIVMNRTIAEDRTVF
jgi:hypothetical protein